MDTNTNKNRLHFAGYGTYIYYRARFFTFNATKFNLFIIEVNRVFFLFDIHISNLNKLADFSRRNKTILIEIDYL